MVWVAAGTLMTIAASAIARSPRVRFDLICPLRLIRQAPPRLRWRSIGLRFNGIGGGQKNDLG